MPHMVIFRTSEGKPGYHPTESLEDAVRFVEHLRNQEAVHDARVFRMNEVPLEVKTYFRVEVAADDAVAPAAPVAPVAHVASVPPVVPVAEDVPRAKASTSRRAAEPDKAPPVAAPAVVDDPIVVEPMGAGGNGANRFGRFNRG